MIEIGLSLGLAQMTNRFNATFLSDVDEYILEANKSADGAVEACPIHYPPMADLGRPGDESLRLSGVFRLFSVLWWLTSNQERIELLLVG